MADAGWAVGRSRGAGSLTPSLLDNVSKEPFKSEQRGEKKKKERKKERKRKRKRKRKTYVDVGHVAQRTLALVGDGVVGGGRRNAFEVQVGGRFQFGGLGWVP